MDIRQESSVVVAVAGFLGAERRALLDFVLGQEHCFSAAAVSQGHSRGVNAAVRRARLLASLGTFESMFVDRLRQQIPPAVDRLGCSFSVGAIEVQATASNDGDFFRLHQDGGPDSTREVSFVYFLHDEPRRFSGGELRICYTQEADGRLLAADTLMAPEGDTLVFFASRRSHEVLPVEVPSRAFADSRFTVNGWIGRSR